MIVRVHYEVGQTALSIVCDRLYLPEVKDAVHEARAIIEGKINEDPFFGTTFEPYPVCKDDHLLVKRMCQASILSNVGPMAGVAGAVSSFAVDKAVRSGCNHIIIDNGGDICLHTSQISIVGIFLGNDGLEDMAFRIPPTGKTIGICSSSGKVGPSVSFGNSSICTVFSDDAILADCCATAFGNMVKEGTSDEMTRASETIASVTGVSGCICFCNGLVSMCGNVPDMVRARDCRSDVTSILF